MDFPSYVPHAVRVSMAARLEGDSWEPTGWVSLLAKAEAEVQRFDRLQIRYADDPEALDGVRYQRLEATQHRDHLAAEVACLQRLVHDARMQPAYARLVGALNSDGHLSAFIYAAWVARIDYGRHRKQVKDAAEMARKVADAAGVLADLLRKAEDTGRHGHFPSGFFSVTNLLEKTEHSPDDRNFHMWEGMRAVVLGKREPTERTPATPNAAPPAVTIEFVPMSKADCLDPEEEARNMLFYAWGTAPGMAQIIATLQREALACVPTESGFIGAALASQKRNRKNEYLRAFGALLRDQHRIELNIEIMNAMATTATVVLNDPDLDVTYDDVRKALAIIAT